MPTVPSQPTAQLGGVTHVFFVEHRHVAVWPPVVAGKLLGTHLLRPGQSFAELEGIYATPELSTEAGDTQHGAQFAQLVEGMYAGDSPDVVAQLGAMSGKRYLVLVRYRNGTVVAAGDQAAGLVFTSKYNTGKAPKERKGYAWQFASPTSSPAAYLTKPFQVQGLGLVTPGQPVPAGTGTSAGTGSVEIYTSRGRYLGTAQAGQKVIIKSPFRVEIDIK